jgi:hypothetical protein
MQLKTLYFLSLLLVALALAPAMAHLLELPNKINVSREAYLIVQQNYRGWALLGLVIAGALFSTLILTVKLRQHRRAFLWSLLSFLCIAGTQAVFWTYTAPANQATSNWTFMPENWAALRQQWEFSHAASAGLNLAALVAVILSVLSWKEPV